MEILNQETDVLAFEIDAIETYAEVLAVRHRRFASDLLEIGAPYAHDPYRYQMLNYIANRVNIRRNERDNPKSYYDLSLYLGTNDAFYRQVITMREDQRLMELTEITNADERDAWHRETVYNMYRVEGPEAAEKYSSHQEVSAGAHAEALGGLAFLHVLDANQGFPKRTSVKKALSHVAYHVSEADRLLELSRRYQRYVPPSFDQLPNVEEWGQSLAQSGLPPWEARTLHNYEQVRRKEQLLLEEREKGPYYLASLEVARARLVSGEVDRYSQRKPKGPTKTALKRLEGLASQVADDPSCIGQALEEVEKIHGINTWIGRSFVLSKLVTRSEFSPDQPIIDTLQTSIGIDLGPSRKKVQHLIGHTLFSLGQGRLALRAIREFPQSHATWAIPYILQAIVDWRVENNVAPSIPIQDPLFEM